MNLNNEVVRVMNSELIDGLREIDEENLYEYTDPYDLDLVTVNGLALESITNHT